MQYHSIVMHNMVMDTDLLLLHNLCHTSYQSRRSSQLYAAVDFFVIATLIVSREKPVEIEWRASLKSLELHE